ncbi:MAG: tRNA pseudouridine(55) synthase TruB [Oscillospiraceae bacterium]|nr:tRNA pseudouridine(55) synthase TruB [Oscillospiraceae bacterium]MCD8375609.1 tRNA pseudouridine(55) synthase TruB [Oscillospiraceae bacterium]
MDGIVIVDKPAGWTSMDVCARLRGVFRQRRAGHAGTLDPMATGVLPVFLGRATRAVEYAAGGDKEYLATLRLGVITDTQDTTGRVLERRAVTVSQAELEALLPRFTGEIEQIPPMYSAVKQGGKKLYQLARQGLEVERKPRRAVIRALELTGGGPEEYGLRVLCGKGTYIRTLCHDLGAALGCGGAMSSLRRTMAAGYTLADAVPLEEILSAPDPAALLRPVDSCFAQFPAAVARGRALRLAQNGNPFPWEGPEGRWRVYAPDGAFLLLGSCRAGVMYTEKSFFEVT